MAVRISVLFIIVIIMGSYLNQICTELQHYQIGQVLPASLASKRKFPPPLSEAEQLGRQAERITEELTALKTENDALKSQLKGMEEKAAEANRRAQEMQRALDAAKTEQVSVMILFIIICCSQRRLMCCLIASHATRGATAVHGRDEGHAGRAA